MNDKIYPFAALVGQETLKTALLLNAVDPAIGGVLICGEKGTAKSTAARALAAILPSIRRVAECPYHCADPGGDWAECPFCREATDPAIIETPAPFVDLPLGATEDRVIGTLDFQQALREGRRSVHPGLLASAHRGVLYIDEVNLLADHLVDVLLDVAAMGVNTIQREGIALRHPSRFLLLGSMNPEEGELRPQFLDRFGLMVTVAGPRDPETRAEIVRRRLAVESDPAEFARKWAKEQDELRQRIVRARQGLAAVEHDDGLLTFITRLCCELQVDGLRSDIVLLRTARALAAWESRPRVTLEDVRAAAELALPHRRRRRRPFEKPGLDPQQLDQHFQQPDSRGAGGSPAQNHADDPPAPENPANEQVFAAAAPQLSRRIETAAPSPATPPPGRRNAGGSSGRGGYVRAVADPSPADLAVDATIRAAVCREPNLAAGGAAIQVLPEDLHGKEGQNRTGSLLLFVVDASGSMAARRRMEAVKGAVLGLLQSAYEERDHVAVLAFRGPEATLLLPPTRSIDAAEQALRSLPTGGRTPLAHALRMAGELIAKTRRSPAGMPVLLIVLTDGKANVALPGLSGDPWQQALTAAAELAGTASLIFDTDAGYIRSGRARQLADALAAECLTLEDLSAETLLLKVRDKSRHLAGRR